MQTLLLFGCFLPLGLIPAVLPVQFIRPLKSLFRWLSVVPLASALILIGFFKPLAALLSYAVALLPLLIGAASLVSAVVGVRLVRQAKRENETITGLVVATVVAAFPFLVVSPFLVYALISLFIQS